MKKKYIVPIRQVPFELLRKGLLTVHDDFGRGYVSNIVYNTYNGHNETLIAVSFEGGEICSGSKNNFVRTKAIINCPKIGKAFGFELKEEEYRKTFGEWRSKWIS